ncbi:MAG: metallophosphoesterase [Clostridia bacterium]|nr:metallophosphoesterase [Clostridia bacterium]
MPIYAIADLHLSFGVDKPMSIFGDNWEGHSEKIKNNWINKVKPEDTVILPGDFSWATYLSNADEDFAFLNELPGKKILLKGNHDYWWTTVTNMKKYLREKQFNTIDFLYNNSYCVENKIIVGTRGWSFTEEESEKMLNREAIRLKLSIEYGIQNYGTDKEMICLMHYPPITQVNLTYQRPSIFVKIMKEYGIKRCYYGHLHGPSHKDAIEGEMEGINFKLISADYLNFDLIEIK